MMGRQVARDEGCEARLVLEIRRRKGSKGDGTGNLNRRNKHQQKLEQKLNQKKRL